MSRVTQETLNKLHAFLDSLDPEVKGKCALCNETLTHIVKMAEVQTGAGTATVARKLADDINSMGMCVPKKGGGEANIYVASTKIYPGLVKIGSTSGGVHSRVRDLGATTLHDYQLECSYSFPPTVRLKKIEKAIHDSLSSYRVRPDREWFYSSCLSEFHGMLENIENVEREF